MPDYEYDDIEDMIRNNLREFTEDWEKIMALYPYRWRETVSLTAQMPAVSGDVYSTEECNGY